MPSSAPAAFVAFICNPAYAGPGNRLTHSCRSNTLHRKEDLSPAAFESELHQAHDQIWNTAIPSSASHATGCHRLIHNMAERFYKHGEAYFQFITNPTIDPTNNVAEQSLRFVVMDRHVTQGTRSPRGQRICERLWTVMATCALQRRSPFEWMCRAITAAFQG